MRLFLAALLFSLPARLFASAIGELTTLGGAMPEAAAPVKARPVRKPLRQRVCPDNWNEKKIGDCWTKAELFDGEGAVTAYVHPAGWLVDPRCFSDKRFSAQDLIDALTVSARKFDPGVSSADGGCLGTYNPEWGAEIKERVWSTRMIVQCPQNYDQTGRVCADEAGRDAMVLDAKDNYRSAPDYYKMISVRNVAGCMVKDSSGLAGTLFHETLHAVGADSVPLDEHNKAWERPQIKFIYDRVYGTEATCFFGAKANIVQCRQAVAYDTPSPRYDLCKGFSATFTDMPPGFLKD